MRIIIVACLLFAATHALAAEQCGVPPKNNQYLLGKPCSLVVNKTFRSLIMSGSIKSALRQTLNAYAQYMEIINDDCLGMNKLLEKADDSGTLRVPSSRWDREKYSTSVGRTGTGLDAVINDAIKDVYGKKN